MEGNDVFVSLHISGKRGAQDVVGTSYTVTKAYGESFTLCDAAGLWMISLGRCGRW